jgi:hypothetical protein
MHQSGPVATDLDLISYLKAIPDARMRRGVRIPAWYLLLVAVLGILSKCEGLRDLERFARRHHGVLTCPASTPLADALARRFQQRFADLIELDDARQVARCELIRAAACLKPGGCTTAAFLKRRIRGALQHYPRDQGGLVRLSRREHENGIHWCWRNGPAVLA